VGPGRVLGGLVRKIHREAQVLSVAEPADVDEIVTKCKVQSAK
jgi:hypothetical protein